MILRPPHTIRICEWVRFLMDNLRVRKNETVEDEERNEDEEGGKDTSDPRSMWSSMPSLTQP
jgi:hypothetical protein